MCREGLLTSVTFWDAGWTGVQHILICQRCCVSIAGTLRAARVHPSGHIIAGGAAGGELSLLGNSPACQKSLT